MAGQGILACEMQYNNAYWSAIHKNYAVQNKHGFNQPRDIPSYVQVRPNPASKRFHHTFLRFAITWHRIAPEWLPIWIFTGSASGAATRIFAIAAFEPRLQDNSSELLPL